MQRPSPLLSDEPQTLLDHLEVSALSDADRNGSAAQLRGALGLAGSTDAIDSDEDEDLTTVERIEGIIDAVFTEAETRVIGCGTDRYPFSLHRKVLVNQDSTSSSVYTFLILLSAFGEDAAPGMNGAKAFEDVCAHATKVYFGCEDEPAQSFVFGFPRRIGAKDFPGALGELCRTHLREGVPHAEMPRAASMKDAGLDIVAWKPFPDRRTSKLIAFGQCATGKNWWEKRYELQPLDWCSTWFWKQPQVRPTKMFFVPHTISDDDWAILGHQAGIIFDRIRIAHLAEQGLPQATRVEIQKWSKSVLSQLES